jgi:hypothetical protein
MRRCGLQRRRVRRLFVHVRCRALQCAVSSAFHAARSALRWLEKLRGKLEIALRCLARTFRYHACNGCRQATKYEARSVFVPPNSRNRGRSDSDYHLRSTSHRPKAETHQTDRVVSVTRRADHFPRIRKRDATQAYRKKATAPRTIERASIAA